MLLGALQNGQALWLVIAAVIFAAISAYYYFRVIQAIYFREPAGEIQVRWEITPGFKILLVVIAALTIIIGVYPELIIGWLYR